MHKRIIRRQAPSCTGFSNNIHPVLARIYAARGVGCDADVDYALKNLLPFTSLKGINDAVTLLSTALKECQRILIVADFDADGATSCALAVRGLRMLGAADVRFVVPNRFEYGYGLTPEIVTVVAQQTPDLLVTVDNGISSIEGVKAAKRLGMRVLITDHHLPGAELPCADAIVNPNQPGDTFPSKNLAGVGVMFYVLLALRAGLREQNWFTTRPEPNLAELLDLVALGTVADVVPLDYNNRIIVHQGLARMRAGRCQPGIRALAQVAGRELRRLTSGDLGYSIGPRLNAAGRLTDMSLGINCLLSDDETAVQPMAAQLHSLNLARREIEGEMQAQALVMVERLGLEEGQELPFGLCLFDDDWHQGVIGILAGRIRERVHRPVIAFARNTGTEIKGSARSIPGVHIRDVLDAVAARHPGLIAKFGGHAMAAGLSLERDKLEAFQTAFDIEIRQHVSAEQLYGTLLSDGELHSGELQLDLAEQLRQAGPWGQGFAEPMFDGVFEVVNRRVIAEKHLKLMVKPVNAMLPIEAMAFNTLGEEWPLEQRRLRLAYRLDAQQYQGMRSAQLLIEHACSE